LCTDRSRRRAFTPDIRLTNHLPTVHSSREQSKTGVWPVVSTACGLSSLVSPLLCFRLTYEGTSPPP
jgi:hypothetical protein